MPAPILATKLYIPPPRPKAVLRPHLLARLNEGLHGKLILVSAPAGFGKTTLVGEWVATRNQPVAWLSLDEADGEPTRFLTYLVAALQTIAPTIGETLLGALHSPQPPPLDTLLTALLNELTSLSDPSILVLDDYHVVDAQPIDHALTFLLEHLPPQMHLVITTREDPPLPLARLRARGQLTELRANDLRFTPTEAAGFFSQVMGLDLLPTQVTALETRTEGWIAGLQLAALSLQGRADVPEFVQAFAGDNRYIVDYLVEEVLQQQPAPVRNFLLQTSILERLSGPLCDAVTEQADGKGILEALERGNLFVVPLDDQRLWYRYHHLFADVLRAHLPAEQPDRVPMLHQRASAWYEQNGLRADCDPPCARRRGLCASRGPGRAGLAGNGRTFPDGHVAALGQCAAGRMGPHPAGTDRGLRVGAAQQRRDGGRRGTAAGGRTLTGYLARSAHIPAGPSRGHRGRGRRAICESSCVHCHRARLPCPVARRFARHGEVRPAGARPPAGVRSSPARAGGSPLEPGLLGRRRPGGSPPNTCRGHGRFSQGRQLAFRHQRHLWPGGYPDDARSSA